MQQLGKVGRVVQLQQPLAVLLAQAVDIPAKPLDQARDGFDLRVIQANVVTRDRLQTDSNALDRLGWLILKPTHHPAQCLLHIVEVHENGKAVGLIDRYAGSHQGRGDLT